jgi:phytanoyl-CoA hydroxylase
LGSVTKLYGLRDRKPKLVDQLIKHPQLVTALTSLLGPNVFFVTNRHNHATVNDREGTKSEARLHRDILYPTRGLVTAVVYLEESTVTNGCTRILPGSHALPLVGVTQPDGGGTWMDEHQVFDGLLEQAVPVPMPEGSILLFNGLVFHSVGHNQSDRTRTSITLGFRSADELEYSPDDHRLIAVAGRHLYRGNDRG